MSCRIHGDMRRRAPSAVNPDMQILHFDRRTSSMRPVSRCGTRQQTLSRWVPKRPCGRHRLRTLRMYVVLPLKCATLILYFEMQKRIITKGSFCWSPLEPIM